MIFQPLIRAGSLDHFAHDNNRPQTAFSLVVGRGHRGAAETGKEVFLLRAQQPLAKGFGFGVAQRTGVIRVALRVSVLTICTFLS